MKRKIPDWVDAKAGQIHLFSLVGEKEIIVLNLIRKLGISTAEELISGIHSGVMRPSEISEKDWNELVQKAEQALPKKTLEGLLNPKPFKAPPGLIDED